MKYHVFAAALLAMIVAGCGGDGRITEPSVGLEPTVLNAIGVDPVSGATIETDLDDYLPGEVVHLTGRGWAPNETVQLFMTEEPNTHEDVSREVQADSAGTFNMHFYDVQPHDLGVTFTLTATGRTSKSVAIAVFTDNRIITLIELLNPATNAYVQAPAQISTSAGGSFTLRVTGTTNDDGGGGAEADDWQSTRWRVRGPAPGNGEVTQGCDAAINITSNTVGAQHVIALTAPVVAGTYTIQATAFRSDNCVDGPSVEVSYQNGLVVVGASNTAPTASAGGPYSGNEGSPITITATATDSDGSIASTLWSVASTTPAGVNCTLDDASALSTTVMCNDNAAATLTLTATDDDGASTPATASITVNNVVPAATFETPLSVSAGSPINLALTSPTDPSSADIAAGFTYAFDCGDGSPYGAFSGTNTKSCPTTAPGSRTVKGKIRDKDGGETEYTASVAISNVPPIADAGGPYSGDEGADIDLTGSGSDPDGGTVGFEWSIDDEDSVCSLTSATSAAAKVNCANDGTWTLTLKVTDDEGASTTATAELTVANVKPTATIVAPTTVAEGSSIVVQLTNPVDPSSVDLANLKYSFDCGSNPGFSTPSASNQISCSTSDDGTRTVKARVHDDDSFSEYSASVNITNVAPTVNAGDPTATITEGSGFSRAGSFADPGTDTWTATVDYGDGLGAQPLALSGKTFNLSHTYANDGVFTIVVKVVDDDTGEGTDQIALTVTNVLPAVNAGADATLNEGDTFARSGSFTDPGADTWTATVNYGDGSGTQPLALVGKTFSLNHTYADNTGGPFTVTVTVSDDDGAGTDMVVLTVNNVAPIITLLTIPTVPVSVSTPVVVDWAFADPGSDTWTCGISWDTNLGFESATYQATKKCTASKALTPGIYTVTVKVTDDDGDSDSETTTAYIVVYDPSGGFVTGGGWIDSPAGACQFEVCTDATVGKANFGFVSKYKKGANTPDGNTEFQFKAGNVNFKSTSYEWLVVAGARAQYKGSGTINGAGSYYFMLSAIDGQVSGGGGIDKFRIKIWVKNANGTDGPVVYDNQMGGDIDADPSTTLGGGSIVIHSK